jgi:hypothetical protein
MAFIFDIVQRLEADPAGDLARGFAAETADPLWLIGRAWQLCEHEGEDASSPVRAAYRCRQTPIDPLDGDPAQDPRTTPAEAIVESEPGDRWTVGLRVRVGRAVQAAASAAGVALPADARLAGLPVPYDHLDDSGFDGRILWERRGALGLQDEWFAGLAPAGPEPADLWDRSELSYDADFAAGPVGLALRRHDGGELDWWSVDADAEMPAPAGPPADATSVLTGRLRYPGAPLPRWWQIEDAAVDVGGYAPDRSHLGTVLLLDLLVNDSDDWFGFPVGAVAGHVATLDEVVVTDSFGDEWKLDPPADGWSMFATDKLGLRSLVVWATAAPLTGPVLEEAVIGIDEDANLVWAVERRIGGREVPADEQPPPAPPAHLDATKRQGFAYRPSTYIPNHWHPYVIEDVDVAGVSRRRFVQGRAADLTGAAAVLRDPPAIDLLQDPAGGNGRPMHQLEPAAIPPTGVRIERRHQLARRTDGSPVLWTQRRRAPLLAPPATRLLFDLLEPIPPAGT